MENKHQYLFATLRGVCIAFFTLWICAVTTLVTWGIASAERSFLQETDTFVICIFCTATVPFIFNSFALAFAYSDNRCINEFLEREDKTVTLKSELKALFSSRAAIFELITTHSIIALASLLGAFISFKGMFPEGIEVGNWLAAVTITPLCFILSLLSKYEAARYYEKLRQNSDIEKLMTPRWLIIRLALLVFLYPIAAPFAPLLLFAGISVFAILAKLSSILTVLGVIAAFAALIFAIWGIKVLRGVSKRKAFLKRMLKAADDSGYEVKKLKNPYRSFVTSKNHCHFTLSGLGKEFECVIISTLWHGAELIFTSATDACFAHRFGTKNHHITLRHRIEFYLHSEGQKIIIVNPVPRDVFIEDEGRQQRIHCSDSIWKMTVHDADSFIGCMERNCLDRN